MPKKMTQEEFIIRAKAVHGDKFDYSNTVYQKALSKVSVSCNTCGYVNQVQASSHLNGFGCPSCSRCLKHTKESFISAAIEKHGERYNYESVVFKNTKTKVVINCGLHGDFQQTPNSHLYGQGCPKCGTEAAASKYSKGASKFAEQARIVHPNRNYDYSKVVYTNNHTPVVIVCPAHGDFEQIPSVHLNAMGKCPTCATTERAAKRQLSKEEFIDRAEVIHSFKYSYKLVDFSKVNNIMSSVEITCPTHGNFSQTIVDHLHSASGCPNCASYGFKGNLSGKLYILSAGNITKVGITNLDVNSRAKDISKSAGFEFKPVLWINFSCGDIASDTETEILRELRKTYKGVEEVFDGYTECFVDVNFEKLVKDIVNISYSKLNNKE